jgi:hypothetical protein
VLLYDLEPMSQSQSQNYGDELRIHAHLEVKVDWGPVEVPPDGGVPRQLPYGDQER